MKVYTCKTLFSTEVPSLNYDVIIGVVDGETVYTLTDLKTDSVLFNKVYSAIGCPRVRYNFDTCEGRYVITTEILADGIRDNIEIEHIKEINGSLPAGLVAAKTNKELARMIDAFIMGYINQNEHIVSAARTDYIYLNQLPDDEGFVILGYNKDNRISKWQTCNRSTVLASLVDVNIAVGAALKASNEGYMLQAVVTKECVEKHPEFFHIIIPKDNDYNTLLMDITYPTKDKDISPFKTLKLGNPAGPAFITKSSDMSVVDKFNANNLPKIYTVQEDDTLYVTGLFYNNELITIKDIVHLNSAYSLLYSLLYKKEGSPLKAIFSSIEEKITCKLQLVVDTGVSQEVTGVSIIPTIMAESKYAEILNRDYIEIANHGVNVANLANAINLLDSLLPEEANQADKAKSIKEALCNTFDSNLDTVEQFTLCDRLVGDNMDVYKNALDTLYNINKTIAQKTCVDTFNRALPSFERLVLAFGDDAQKAKIKADPLAETQDVLNAYTTIFNEGDNDNYDADVEYSTTDDSDLDTDSDSIGVDDTEAETVYDTQEHYSDFEMCIDLEHMPLNKDVANGGLGEYFDSKFYVDIYNKYPKLIAPPECIGGADVNNLLPIQKNELFMYAGLRRLVLEGICFERDIYTIEQLKQELANCVHSEIVDKFIRYFAQDIFELNWRHTGAVVVNLKELRDNPARSRDADFYIDKFTLGRASSDSFISLGQYKLSSNGKVVYVSEDSMSSALQAFKMPQTPDYFRQISGFLINNVINSLAWVETAIRLARWNIRKPAMLSIPTKTGNSKFLNLHTYTTQDWGGLFDTEKQVTFCNSINSTDIDTCNYVLDACIASETEGLANIIDIVNFYNLPITDKTLILFGVALTKLYTDTDMTHTTYVDIFTLARGIADGALKVAGITFDKNTKQFVITNIKCLKGNVSEEQVSPLNTFSVADNVPLSAALSNVASNPGYYEVLTSSYLADLWIKINQNAGMSSKGTRIFDVLNCFSISGVDKQLLNRCTSILDSLESTDKLKSFIRSYAWSQEQAVNTLMFSQLAPDYLQLALQVKEFIYTNSAYPEINDILDMTYSISLQQHKSKGVDTTAAVQTNTISQKAHTFKMHYDKCKKFYSFTYNGKIVLYIGEETFMTRSVAGDERENYNFVFWTPEDNDAVIALGCEDKTSLAVPINYSDLTAHVVGIFWQYVTVAFSKTNTPEQRKNARTMLFKLKQSRYFSFTTYSLEVDKQITDTFSQFVFSVWFTEAKRLKGNN